jgi:hypothetical protein
VLSTILGTFKSFFGRAFWFGNFLPVLIVAAIHALILATAFPATLDLPSLERLTVGQATERTGLVFAMLVLAAYVAIPFVSFFNGVLDGSLLPRWIYDKLRRDRFQSWRKATGEYRDEQAAANLAEETAEECRRKLSVARAAGGKIGAVTNQRSIVKAEAAVAAVRPKASATVAPDRAALTASCDVLVVALTLNTTDPNAAGPEHAWAERLDAMHYEFDRLLSEWVKQSSHDFEALIRRRSSLDLQDWQATRLGDVRREVERYAADAYAVDFKWIWPRLAIVLPNTGQDADTGAALRLTTAVSQRDFAVLLLILAYTIPMVWLPLLAATGGSLWVLLLIGWLFPLLSIVLYELVIRSEIAFGEVVATVIDEHRLALLEKLHLARPRTLAAEKKLWRRLVRAGAPGNFEDLEYKPETTS